MATFEEVKAGLTRYLDVELMPKITGWQKWAAGAGISIYLEKGVDAFNALKENEFIKALDVINSENEINIDKLYKAFLKEAKKSAITFKAPLIGDCTFKAEDVEKLYTYIKEFEK